MEWVREESRSALQLRAPPKLVCLVVVAICAIFMFVDRHTPPLILWDESRLAVNALEMNQRGWSLITTYGFVPDLWNSKPPLMIWLMNASITVFGGSELSLRLPSMLASIGTLIVVFMFVRRFTHSAWTAAFAVTLLTTSAGFYGEHGARTADYDGLLCFFTTAYLSILFSAVHSRRPGYRTVLAAGAFLAAAAMTKTIAAVVPGAGVLIYLMFSKRLDRAFGTPRYTLMVVCALLPLATFYLAREWLAPGYLQVVWYNDFAGRYENQLGLDGRPWWFYAQAVLGGGIFSAGLLALFAPFGLLGLKGQARQALLFALCCAGAQLVLISIPATRLVQYLLPALPWLAIACAIAASQQLHRILNSRALASAPGKKAMLSCGLAAAVILVIGVPAARLRYGLLVERAFSPQASYGALFSTLHNQRVRHLTVLEPGIDIGTLKSYAPQLRYYVLLWNERGMVIDEAHSLGSVSNGSIVASCTPGLTRKLLMIGAKPTGVDGCFEFEGSAIRPK